MLLALSRCQRHRTGQAAPLIREMAVSLLGRAHTDAATVPAGVIVESVFHWS
jgi:hypothetical protein